MKRCVLQSAMVCGLILLAFCCARNVGAQATTGSVYGRVGDPSKAVVAGASVVAENQATGVTYSGETDSNGNFSIHELPPGSYTVTVTKPGFATTTINNVELAIDQKQLLNFDLQIGAVTTVTTVTGEPTMLQTQSAETGEVIGTHDILDLPLLGRQFLDLVTLTAGVLPANGAVSSFSVSINGQRGYANSIMIDGIEATTNRTNDITVTPGVDSVQEFKILTSAYSAEYGRAAGGVVSIQTKSGTNAFHGDAFEFFRPNFTAARPFSFGGVAEPASSLKQHNYGGTLGGPIRKNKAFFFVSFERTKSSTAYTELDGTPPLEMINVLPDGSVDLSHMVDPGSGTEIPIFNPASPNPADPLQFPGNVIPASMVSKAGFNTLFDFFPNPNLTGTNFGWFSNFQAYSPVTFTGNLGDARYDQEFSSKDHFSVVYHYGDSNQLTTDPYHGKTVVPGGGDADQANNEVLRNQELSVTETHVFNSRMLNEARFGYTRLREDLYSLLNGHDYSTEYGVGNVDVPSYPATEGYPYIYLGTGYITGGSTYKPYLELDSNFQFADNFTISSVGKHEFKFGADFRRLNSNPNFSLFPTGFQYYASYGFSATSNDFNAFYPNTYMFDGGSDIADLLLGIPESVDIGLQLTKPHTQSWEMHYYVQDDYKVSPKLTVNAGIRYEFQAPYTEASNGASNYDIATDSLLLAGRGGNSASLVNTRWNDFGPRLGIAYQIDSKTVIRAGYGFFYSPENDAREDILTKNYPFAIQAKYTNPFYTNGPYEYILDTGVPRDTNPPIPSGASSIPTTAIPNGSLETTFYEDPNMKTGYSQSYNVTLQRELASSFSVEVGYVGSVSHDLSYQIGNINQFGNISNYVTPNLGQIQTLDSAGWGEYSSLQIKVTKRASRNLSFLASYTYGHNIDNGPAPFDVGHVGANTPQDPYNLRGEVANADDDLRHNFVFSGLYRLPIGKGQRLFSNWGTVHELVLGGWQINGIFVSHTGTPLNVVFNGSNSNCAGVRPDLVPGQELRPPTVPGTYFNTAAFTAPAGSSTDSCAFGDAGRNILNGPGFVNADLSLFKEFPIKEFAKLQTRLEAFNSTNSPHFANPQSDMGSPSNLGVITGTVGNMRIIQLAAKFIF
ncbi:MAG: carboxypeptidase regulatory-like domain-containing protein [Candidatus Acidiferrales bacterium]